MNNAEMEDFRNSRWNGKSVEEAEYEAHCAYWESLTADEANGIVPTPSWDEFRAAWFEARQRRVS